jgi:type II secretory pathway pseudopilin PulG
VKNPSQEDLLGYVLGALDAQEQRNVQQLIDQNPELEERLLEIKSSLLPLDLIESAGPRPGLARRTCESVAACQAEFPVSESFETDPGMGASALADNNERTLWIPSTWSMPDFAVAAGLMAILAGILFPTLSYQRYNSRLHACQNNIRQLGSALMQFSDMNCGQFVEIPRSGNLSVVGSVAPILKDRGLIEDDSLFACAGLVSSDDPPVHIPTIETVLQADGEQLAYLQRTMSGHYGYTMGYRCGDRYYPPKNLGRTNVVLLADMPSLNLVGRVSQNHAGRGQNCFFEDGHIEFVRGQFYGEDPIFVNDCNMVAPGCRPDDNVIAPSHLSPIHSVLKLQQGDPN